MTVLDVSGTALELARRRLGQDADSVDWITHDLLSWSPTRRYRLRHDRAVFHFLVPPSHRAAYIAVLPAALWRGQIVPAVVGHG